MTTVSHSGWGSTTSFPLFFGLNINDTAAGNLKTTPARVEVLPGEGHGVIYSSALN